MSKFDAIFAHLTVLEEANERKKQKLESEQLILEQLQKKRRQEEKKCIEIRQKLLKAQAQLATVEYELFVQEMKGPDETEVCISSEAERRHRLEQNRFISDIESAAKQVESDFESKRNQIREQSRQAHDPQADIELINAKIRDASGTSSCKQLSFMPQ
jgi:chromosome segregation ATPase